MTEKPYGLVHAKSLLAPCGASEQWDIDERGVFPKPQPTPPESQTQTVTNQLAGYDLLLAWRPAEVFKDDTPAPDLINTPSLPLPFDARDLAAFMLHGVGGFVADFYGEWEDGPKKCAIDEINPLDTFARQAVIEAFAACREAQKIVGPYPLELDDKAERARKAWSVANKDANQREGVFDSKPGTKESEARRERAKASIAALDLEREATAAEAKTAQGKWLEAMVRELLKPARDISEGGIGLGGLGDKGVTNTDKPKGLTETQPIQRSAAQDAAILEVIKTLGHDPLHLPRNEAGKPGVKAKVREAVGKNKLFKGSTVFEKAWERLTASHDIVIDKVSP